MAIHDSPSPSWYEPADLIDTVDESIVILLGPELAGDFDTDDDIGDY